MRFRMGDIVKISKKSEWLNVGQNNPVNTEGKIINITDGDRFKYEVKWGNHRKAYYADKDLGLVRRAS